MPVEHLDDPPATADLVIVGSGILGAATALHAARAGLRAVVVERRPALATLTTAAAAGGFRLQLDGDEDLRLIRESVEFLYRFEEETGQREHDPNVTLRGYLWVTTEEAGAERQQRLVEEQRGWGLDDVELLSGDEARSRFPFLSPEVVQARFRQGDGSLEPRAAALGMLVGSGVPAVTGCAVTGFRVQGDRLAAVETQRGAIATRAAVIAAGPFASALAETVGVRLPVEMVLRHKVVVPDAPQVPPDAPMTIDEDTGAHWRPALGGAYLLFTDPATPPSEPADSVPIDQGFAFRLLEPESPVAVARVAPFWRRFWEGSGTWMLQAGHYVMTPDRRPLLGALGIEGLFLNTGYSGKGVMGGIAGSRRVVDVITGKTRAEEEPYRPDRPLAERPKLDPL
ncbi:MAG TPA: FAD-dependent oxidoreductase [Actinomycetota bacterium]|nr:FAD-dependent oxidoreductase [Actinomycetota bacterium]